MAVRRTDWRFLFVSVIIVIAGGLGNTLVCLAVVLDKRLHNLTNYFLFSLAIADLLVSLFVMPMGAIPGFLGEFIFCSFSLFILFSPPLFNAPLKYITGQDFRLLAARHRLV